MSIYFDNAATTPLHPDVVDVMTQVLREDYGNPSSIHHIGRKAKSLVEKARKTVATIINASISEVFFTSCATESNNMILKNAVKDLGVRRIISSPTEHHCVLHTLDILSSNHSCEIVYLKVDKLGRIDKNELESLLNQDAPKTLVSIMHGNNEIGTLANIDQIGQLCHQYGALFHSDTVQTMGKYPIDVAKSHINFLSGSAHKFHGPKGSGFVFISNQNIISPYLNGGAQERNMRAGTENVAGIIGLASALDISNSKTAENFTKILSLRQLFKSLLEAHFEDIRYNGPQNDGFLAHVLSVSFPASPKADMLVMNLDIAGICASSGSACSAGIEEDSHVLKAIGHPKDRKTIRFSFSPYNTEDEVRCAIENMKSMVATKNGG